MTDADPYYAEGGIYHSLSVVSQDVFPTKDTYNSVIPRVVFLTWKSKELPPNMYANVLRLIRDNPEMEFHYFDDTLMDTFIRDHFNTRVYEAYRKIIPGAFRADFWRYCVLYVYGGIYLDIKLRCIHGFKLVELTESEHVCIDRPDYWIPGGIGLYNGVLACKPGNKLMLAAVNQCVQNVEEQFHGQNALYPTGPGTLGYVYLDIHCDVPVDLALIGVGMGDIVYKNTHVLEQYPEYRCGERAEEYVTMFYSGMVYRTD